MSPRLAVHHQCYKSPRATKHAAELFLRWNPGIPYFLYSDCGDDYSELASDLNLVYNFSNTNVGHSHYDSAQLLEFLSRIRTTADQSNADLILWMEDDVITRGRLKISPDVKSTCLSTTHVIWPACHQLLRSKYNVEPNVPSWGMAGGAMLSGPLFRNNWAVIEQFVAEDYPFLIKECGTEIRYGDVLLQMIHMIVGIPCSVGRYVVDHCERPFPAIPGLRHLRKYHYNRKPLVHGIKSHY